mmetsp:Transcript_53132/g.108354  ORF Transcript_53132/g.108354 Transcript_53132/m.108354 type:complete len:212 (-) Transcript_53132:1209-1844(-)
MDDLAVAAPRQLDRLLRPDPRRPGVAGRAEPVVLGGASGASAEAAVGGAVDGVGEERLLEARVVRHNRRCEVLFQALEALEDERQLLVPKLRHNLEGPEDLGGDERKDFGAADDFSDGDEDSRGLDGSKACRNRVLAPVQLLAAKEKLGARHLEQSLHVVKHLLCRHTEDGPDSEVLERTLLRKLRHARQKVRLVPVLVHEEHGLSGALLA